MTIEGSSHCNFPWWSSGAGWVGGHNWLCSYCSREMPSGLCLWSRLLTFNTYASFLQTDRGPSPFSSLQRVWRHPCLIQISHLWKHHPADLKAMWRGRWRWRQPPFAASVTLCTAGPALSSSISEQIIWSHRPPISQNNSKCKISLNFECDLQMWCS